MMQNNVKSYLAVIVRKATLGTVEDAKKCGLLSFRSAEGYQD